MVKIRPGAIPAREPRPLTEKERKQLLADNQDKINQGLEQLAEKFAKPEPERRKTTVVDHHTAYYGPPRSTENVDWNKQENIPVGKQPAKKPAAQKKDGKQKKSRKEG